MSLRPLPAGTTHMLNEKGMAFLPLFVQARLDYLAQVLEWYPDASEDGEEENDEGSLAQESDSEEDGTCFTYYEVQGKLSDGYYSVGLRANYVSPINIWIGSDDNCHRNLYLGGSPPCWICPSNHALYFDAIDPALLQETPEPNEWWCIRHEEGIKVIKIIVCPPEVITEHFPNEV